MLLEWNASVAAADNRGRVALHAAATGGASDVVAALLARGAAPAVAAAGGLTPLDLAVYAPPPPAASFTDGSTIDALVAGGAAVARAHPWSGQTALHAAAFLARWSQAWLLKRRGAEEDSGYHLQVRAEPEPEPEPKPEL